jgi:hypothetical protein
MKTLIINTHDISVVAIAALYKSFIFEILRRKY